MLTSIPMLYLLMANCIAAAKDSMPQNRVRLCCRLAPDDYSPDTTSAGLGLVLTQQHRARPQSARLPGWQTASHYRKCSHGGPTLDITTLWAGRADARAKAMSSIDTNKKVRRLLRHPYVSSGSRWIQQ